MTNDILEQVVEDYFRSQGYFTQHNVKYRPDISRMSIEKKRKYSVHSDVDVLAIHPHKKGRDKVLAISCKSWQGGIDIEKTLKMMKGNLNRIYGAREMWKTYREIVSKEWGRALINEVEKITGRKEFIFYTALTKIKGDKSKWENFPMFKNNLKGCDIKLLDMETMIKNLYKDLTTTPAHSEL